MPCKQPCGQFCDIEIACIDVLELALTKATFVDVLMSTWGPDA